MEGDGGAVKKFKTATTGSIMTSVGESQFYSKVRSTINIPNPLPLNCVHANVVIYVVLIFGLQQGINRIDSSPDDSAAGALTSAVVTSPRKSTSSRREGSTSSSKFPKLDECAHFHYEVTDICNVKVRASIPLMTTTFAVLLQSRNVLARFTGIVV